MDEIIQPPKLTKHVFILSIDENSIKYCIEHQVAMIYFQDLLHLYSFEKKDIVFDQEDCVIIWKKEVEIPNNINEVI